MANQLPMFKLLNPQATQPSVQPQQQVVQQQIPQSGTDIMNQAATTAIQQGVHDNNVDNVMKQVANDGQKVVEASKLLGISPFDGDNLSKLAMTRRFQDLTIGTKQAYDTALANGDQAGMTAARQQAQIYRDAAQKAGIDLSSVGADRTLAQAQAARNVFNAKQYGNLMTQSADSGQVYDSEFSKARQAGMSSSAADEYAYQKATAYQQKRVQALQDELFTQGINPDNSINAYGIQLIGAMRNEDPDSADLALTTFGLPINNYTFGKKEQAADSALLRKQNLMEHDTSDKLKILGAQTDSKSQLMRLQAGLQEEFANANYQRQKEMIDRYGAGMFQGKGGGKSGSSSGGNNSSNGIKLNAAQTKFDNRINSSMTNLKRLLAQPKQSGQKVATAEEAAALDELNKAINEAEASGEFDPDTIDKYREWAQNLGESYQHKYGYSADSFKSSED
ncbi:MAG: hypothetical protein SPG66_02070 [Anaerovibrio sp.]|nr:hypothetical protein [Anaerovibrio sp.]